MAKTNEVIIPLSDGCTLRCGPGDTYAFGGYVRICDKNGHEQNYWTSSEWAEEPELVMGAIFGACDNND